MHWVLVPNERTTTDLCSTTTITSSVPYQYETCAAVTPVVRKRQSNHKMLDFIPRDCCTSAQSSLPIIYTNRLKACYITSTSTCGQATTTITVTKPDATALVTQLKLTTVVKYIPKTSKVLQTATAVLSAISTESSTTVVTSTEVHTITSRSLPLQPPVSKLVTCRTL